MNENITGGIRRLALILVIHFDVFEDYKLYFKPYHNLLYKLYYNLFHKLYYKLVHKLYDKLEYCI